MHHFYVLYLTKFFSSGEYPATWKSGLISVIHKSGDTSDPNNYRGITVNSCLSKTFCSILNTRLKKYLQENHILSEWQIGFRPKSRTSDHILVLRTLIDKYTKKLGRKNFLYCCFIDFKKAFDTVWHHGLFYKCIQYKLGTLFLNIVKDMYRNASVQIRTQHGLSHPIHPNVGVKQGCVLSPSLFNLYINDLPDLFNAQDDPARIYDKDLNCLLYADDLILISTSENGLRSCLSKLEKYCTTWKLNINCKKSKVVIFNKSGRKIKGSFSIGGSDLQIVNSYKYLGIEIQSNGSFSLAISNLKEKARKALFKLNSSLHGCPNSLKLQLNLYEKMIKPIMLYACEVWGAYSFNINKYFEINDPLKSTNAFDHLPSELLDLTFCKHALGVHKRTSNLVVRSELGRYPISIDCAVLVVKNWLRITSLDPS